MFACLTEIEKKQSCYRGIIAAMIENGRYGNKITVIELAEKTGISEERIMSIENCDCDITVSELINLCETLNIPYNLTFRNDKNEQNRN